MLALTFSGGGTRAAAFAYGVLQELGETHIRLDGRRRRLLDVVATLDTDQRGAVERALAGTGCEALLDNSPRHRLAKREFKLCFERSPG